MPQILDSLSPEDRNVICCCYVNSTSQIQIARITNVHEWYFERVVFPGQKLLFETPKHGYLEIHTGMMASSILSDKIPCQQLIVTADDPLPFFEKQIAPELEYAN